MLDRPTLRIALGRGIANHLNLIALLRAGAAPRALQILAQHTNPSMMCMQEADIRWLEPEGLGLADYVQNCLDACKAHQAEVFLPGRALPLLAARAGEFQAIGTKILLAGSVHILELLDDKVRFYREVAKTDIPCMPMESFTDPAGFARAWDLLLPRYSKLCIKPARSIFARGFRVLYEKLDPWEEFLSDPNYRMQKSDFLRILQARCEQKGQADEMLLMPYLEGPEWSIDCFVSQDRSQQVIIPRRKRSEKVQELADAPGIAETARQLLDHFQLHGVVNVQLREHKGKAYVLEINPRAAGGIGMTQATGVNLPWLPFADALKIPYSIPPHLKLGLRFGFFEAWHPVHSESGTPEKPARKSSCMLPTGTLHLEDQGGRWKLSELVDFAARNNTKRGFLFVSKVLGKHLPVTPSRQRASTLELARQLPDLPEPVLFAGLAETATGLGLGVFSAWKTLHPGAEGLFLHSTRYQPANAKVLCFDESHSHAPSQLLCLPKDPALLKTLKAARSLVVVDDELTTGKTATQLYQTLLPLAPELSRFVVCSLLDMRPDKQSSIESISLGKGSFSFESGSSLPALPAQPAVMLAPEAGLSSWGRLGLSKMPRLPAWLVEAALKKIGKAESVLILGTGECMYPASLLGQALEQQGKTVFLQATTRSPILPGAAIASVVECQDPLGADIPFFLYNVRAGQYESVLILYEPGAAGIAGLCEQLQAHAFEVPDDPALFD